MNKKILINTPHINYIGGVANHYLGLKDYFNNNIIYNQFYTSSLVKTLVKNKYLYWFVIPVYFIMNILKFIFKIIILRKPIILLNPSFGKTALKRDSVYIKIAKFFGCKVAVFMHGWDKEYLNLVLNKKEPFSLSWGKVDLYFVLANEFRDYLKELGIKSPIHLTTTKVDDKLLEGIESRYIAEVKTILFLARVEQSKGVLIAIDTIAMLKKKYPNIILRVVGNGNFLEEAKEYCKLNKISNVFFTGSLAGKDLKSEFSNAELYILPTTHGEGMPTSVLEAMAFGLPIITRPVGGLVDFFQNNKMGYLIESIDANDYVEKIEYLMDNIDKINEISKFNMEFAKEKFMATKVAKELESILVKSI